MFSLLALILALSPAYTIRFKLGPLPLNALEILVFAFWLAFIIWIYIKKLWPEFKAFVLNQPKLFLLFAGLFLLSGLASAFVSPNRQRAVGLFLVFFFQPILTYLPAKFILQKNENKNRFVSLLFALIAIASLYGIIQYFTLIGLPQEWWGNTNEPKRALSFFEYPNAFALYLTPLLAYLLPFVFERKREVWTIIAYLLGVAGLVLSLSRGGWLGFAAAVAVYLIFWGSKKTRLTLAAGALVAIIIVAAIPNLRYRVILPFMGEKSTVSRFSLWHTADKMIKDSPVLGKGLYGFKTDFDAYNTDPGIASINYPHNIFLNFWVETGLLGLLSFLAISIYAFWQGIKQKTPYGIGVALFLIAVFVHGLADAPYFLNNLALIFWIILGTI